MESTSSCLGYIYSHNSFRKRQNMLKTQTLISSVSPKAKTCPNAEFNSGVQNSYLYYIPGSFLTSNPKYICTIKSFSRETNNKWKDEIFICLRKKSTQKQKETHSLSPSMTTLRSMRLREAILTQLQHQTEELGFQEVSMYVNLSDASKLLIFFF